MAMSLSSFGVSKGTVAAAAALAAFTLPKLGQAQSAPKETTPGQEIMQVLPSTGEYSEEQARTLRNPNPPVVQSPADFSDAAFAIGSGLALGSLICWGANLLTRKTKERNPFCTSSPGQVDPRVTGEPASPRLHKTYPDSKSKIEDRNVDASQPHSSPKPTDPAATSTLASSAFSLPRAQPLPYGSSLLDAGNFQVVAFANAIVGTPTGDLSRFPKTDHISVAGTVALPGISKDDANVYARKFYGDRTVLKAQEEVLAALKVLESLHQKVLEKEVGKVGLRNLRISPTGEMLCDVERVPFAAFGHFATKGCSEAHFNAGGATGVCMILLTADDQIVVQKRSAKNRFFGGIPGASIAGLVDYKLNSDGRITTESIIERARIEGIEELGVRGHEIVDIAMTGVLFEVAKPHHEISFVGKTTLTAAEIRARVKNNLASSTGNALPFDFAEKAFTVPNTPADLINLVAECRAPMPSTHAGALVTAAYHLIAKQQGPEAAQAWAADIGEKCREYYRSLDSQVAEYYRSDRSRYFEIPKRFTSDYSRKISTGELEQVTDAQLAGFLPKGFEVQGLSTSERLAASAMYLGVIPKRNINAYEPGLLPEEQGLPSLSSELNRLGYEGLH